MGLNISESDKKNFSKICKWLQHGTGLHFPPSKQATFLSKLYQLCKRLKLSGLDELSQYLESNVNPELELELVSVATTNHSYFFREDTVCNFFKTKIIPKLDGGQSIRMWSSACASGEEAYTFAIMLKENFSHGIQNVSILGTDLDQNAVAKAEKAIYSKNSLKTVPAHLLQQYFKEQNNVWVLSPDIKKICTFRRLNLKSTPWPFTKQFHIIACRNVLYYFNREDQQKLINRLYESTLPGGWLLTSVTESFQNIKSPWKMVTAGVYSK
jgi:chemotaxis protein methyltransferase CheR